MLKFPAYKFPINFALKWKKAVGNVSIWSKPSCFEVILIVWNWSRYREKEWVYPFIVRFSAFRFPINFPLKWLKLVQNFSRWLKLSWFSVISIIWNWSKNREESWVSLYFFVKFWTLEIHVNFPLNRLK